MQSFTRSVGRVAVVLAVAVIGGCASYAPPGRGADLAAMSPGAAAAKAAAMRDANTDDRVRDAIDKPPLARFPTAIALARVQSPGYHSKTAEGWGSGRYSVVTTRDVEKDAQLEAMNKWPLVKGVAPVNRLLLPDRLESDLELREAAAKLQADVLLIYTLDTTFTTPDHALPLTVISLGLSPNQTAEVRTTASALIMDTRNGYIYGLAEATASHTQLANAWTSDAAVDQSRQKTESEAFAKLVTEMGKTWVGVVAAHGAQASAGAGNVGP